MSAAESKPESSSPAAPPAKNSLADKKKADKKRSKKKKKHISKHVLKAKSEAKEKVVLDGADAGAGATGTGTTSIKKTASKETVKDPTEASAYLNAWQAQEGWKFNKNTQSWLLRHMYETEKVSKSTFTILLEYMKGLQGKDAKKRVFDEATARAKRYRDYENAQEAATTAVKGSDEHSKEAPESATTGTTVSDDDDGSYGLAHWNSLDDHGKRKEYKRARRVLEVLMADP